MTSALLKILSRLADRVRPPPASHDGRQRIGRAQRVLINALPEPVIVTALADQALLHANHAARAWLAGVQRAPLHALFADPEQRRRFVALASRPEGVDDFALRWTSARGVQRMTASARACEFFRKAALLTTLTPVGAIEPFGVVGPPRDAVPDAAPVPAPARNAAAPAALPALPVERARHLVRLREALAHAVQDGNQVGVVMLRIDQSAFDALPGGGEEALRRAVEASIVRAVRSTDAVCRLGDDGYTVLLTGAATAVQLERVVRLRLIECMRRLSPGGDHEPGVACSIGVAAFPADGRDAETLLWRAAAAMRAANACSGSGRRVLFASDLPDAGVQRDPQSPHGSVAGEALQLYWQPRIDARSGRVCGLDAHAYRRQSAEEALDAARFVLLPETDADIHAVGRWALDEACAQQQRWRAAGLPVLPLSLRVGAAQLLDAAFVSHVGPALAGAGVDPALIGWVLAEPEVAGCEARLADALRRMRALGCRLALERFGTGRSSLEELHGLPIDALRIDASFVGELRHGADPAIVDAMVALGRALGVRVAADGVTQSAQEAVLLASGCDELQGTLYGPPMSADACAAWLREQGDLRTGAVLAET